MFAEEFASVLTAGKKKVQLLTNNLPGYFVSAMLAGIYVGLGIILIFTVGGLLTAGSSPWAKTAMGVSFGIALSLVIIAGSELFTGNVFVMTAGLLKRSVSISKALWLLLISYLGNLAGSVLLAAIYYLTGLSTGPVGEFIAKVSATKMGLPASQLFFRGLLCNLLVCLAVWSSFRCKEEIAKLVMVFWCLFAFITSGFEHSIANMTLLAIALFNPLGQAVSLAGYGYNLLWVTLGNIVGAAVFLAIPYFMISLEKKEA